MRTFILNPVTNAALIQNGTETVDWLLASAMRDFVCIVFVGVGGIFFLVQIMRSK